MSSAQRQAISSPENGLMVYQTDETAGYWYYDGTLWTTYTKNNVARIPEWITSTAGWLQKRLDSFKLAPKQCAELSYTIKIDGCNGRQVDFEVTNLTTQVYYRSGSNSAYSPTGCGEVTATGTMLFSNPTSFEKEYVILITKN